MNSGHLHLIPSAAVAAKITALAVARRNIRTAAGTGTTRNERLIGARVNEFLLRPTAGGDLTILSYRKVSLCLVVERLYKEMALLPDSPVKEGRRTIRTILVIDEAHNYLSQKNIFLQRITREGRSKGIVVFFASQSPNDYQQKFFNFQELLEFAYIFQCEGVGAGSVQDILGCSARTAKDLQTEIARSEPWQAIARSPGKTEELLSLRRRRFIRPIHR